MAEIVRYVNTASPGGNGTTNGESGSNAAYASLSAWEAAEQTNLVTSASTMTVYCGVGTGTAADTVVSVNGWTTSPEYNITIQANPNDTNGDQSAQMPYNSSIYRMQSLGVFSSTVGISSLSNYVTVKGLQVKISWNGSNGATNITGISVVSNCVVDSCLVELEVLSSSTDANSITGILLGNCFGHNCVVKVVNNKKCENIIGIRIDRGGTLTSHSYARNCTAIVGGNTPDGGTLTAGFLFVGSSGVGTSAINCLAYSDTGSIPCFNVYTTATTGSSEHNASSDNTASGPDSLFSKTFTFVDSASGDFHISPSDTSGVIGGGVDLSSFFTTDFDGNIRTVPWTIGAFELNASSGGVTKDKLGFIPFGSLFRMSSYGTDIKIIPIQS